MLAFWALFTVQVRCLEMRSPTHWFRRSRKYCQPLKCFAHVRLCHNCLFQSKNQFGPLANNDSTSILRQICWISICLSSYGWRSCLADICFQENITLYVLQKGNFHRKYSAAEKILHWSFIMTSTTFPLLPKTRFWLHRIIAARVILRVQRSCRRAYRLTWICPEPHGLSEKKLLGRQTVKHRNSPLLVVEECYWHLRKHLLGPVIPNNQSRNQVTQKAKPILSGSTQFLWTSSLGMSI